MASTSAHQAVRRPELRPLRSPHPAPQPTCSRVRGQRPCRQRPCRQTPEPDQELLSFNVRLAKNRQALLDTQRIERKAFREHARIENAAAAARCQLRRRAPI